MYETFEQFEDSRTKALRKFYLIASVTLTLALLLILMRCDAVHAQQINLDVIAKIESSGCKQKYGKYEHARGCWQLTKPVVDEWNQRHSEKYDIEDMVDNVICRKVADWYLHVRIPQMLRYYKTPVTTENILISYNAGIGNAIKGRVPEITKRYLDKYKRFTRR